MGTSYVFFLWADIDTQDSFFSCSSLAETLLLNAFHLTNFKNTPSRIIFSQRLSVFSRSTVAPNNLETDSHVTWCQRLGEIKQLAVAALAYGNEPYVDRFYQAAAILIAIPQWNERSAEEPSPKRPHMSEN